MPGDRRRKKRNFNRRRVCQGPDLAYLGIEIAFNSNEDTLTVVDLTNKSSPTMLSRTSYPQQRYSH